MLEVARTEPICIYCKELITPDQWPYKRLESGETAHLPCFLDNLEKEEKKPGS